MVLSLSTGSCGRNHVAGNITRDTGASQLIPPDATTARRTVALWLTYTIYARPLRRSMVFRRIGGDERVTISLYAGKVNMRQAKNAAY
jgi:hypothetical protein